MVSGLKLVNPPFMTYTGWTYADAPDEARLKSIGDEMRDQILSIHDEFYTSEKSIGLYPTTGTASDWYSFTINCEWLCKAFHVCV